MRRPLLFLALLLLGPLSAQRDSSNVPFSENGWCLSPHGTIRILVIFAQIEYDKNPKDDPFTWEADHWPSGKLPTWKDDLFDPYPSATPQAQVTRYYHDISMGRFIVLGDYIDRLITIKESEVPSLKSSGALSNHAVTAANKLPAFHTAHELGIADFDLWKEGGKPGMPKLAGPDSPHSFDHVMVILRNSSILTHGQGSTDPGSSGKLFGYESDTQSRFGAMNGVPFEILKHEFNHLLLGGNNFHSGGGNAKTFQSYFINVQGGWSMMGAAGSSLLTASAWDRYRMGWYATDAAFAINARSTDGRPVNGDLDPLKGDTGIYVLRDFVPSGDALRIRMPYLGNEEYPQWIWLENHQTFARNGSPTDRFHFESQMPCVHKAVPAIHALLQVDREEKRGKDIYKGYADYLRPLPATGLHDRTVRGDTMRFECLWAGNTRPLVTGERWADPFSGTHELELMAIDEDGDGNILRTKESVPPQIDVFDGQLRDDGRFHGHTDQCFTPQGRNKLGMATNPPLVNMCTLVNTPGKDSFKGGAPNTRVVHLAGFSATLLEQRADGSIALRIRNDDTRIDRDVRWCADSIVLHPVRGEDGRSLLLAEGRRLLLDRSPTPTRIDKPEKVDGTTWFSDPTRFTVLPDARMFIANKAKVDLINGSELHLMPGSVLELAPKAGITADKGSRIVVHAGARTIATPKQLKKLRRSGAWVEVP